MFTILSSHGCNSSNTITNPFPLHQPSPPPKHYTPIIPWFSSTAGNHYSSLSPFQITIPLLLPVAFENLQSTTCSPLRWLLLLLFLLYLRKHTCKHKITQSQSNFLCFFCFADLRSCNFTASFSRASAVHNHGRVKPKPQSPDFLVVSMPSPCPIHHRQSQDSQLTTN